VELGAHGTIVPVPPIVGSAGVIHDMGNSGAIPMGTEPAATDGTAQATRLSPRFARRPRNPKAHIAAIIPPRGRRNYNLVQHDTNRRVCSPCGTRTRTRCSGCFGRAMCMGACFDALHQYPTMRGGRAAWILR
jgi:hypothetical protein